MPTVLSVQSRVAYGHVGNAASVFPLQRLGIEAWALDTVAFSNHTGHGQWRGAVGAGGDDRRAVRGHRRARRAAGDRRGAVGLSRRRRDRAGVARHRRADQGGQPAGAVLLRPGDRRHRYRLLCHATASPSSFATRALALADIVTPNRFELEYLTGRTVANLARGRRSRRGACAGAGRRSCWSPASSSTGDRIAMLAAGPDGAWAVETPRLPVDAERLRRCDRGAVSRPSARGEALARCARAAPRRRCSR